MCRYWLLWNLWGFVQFITFWCSVKAEFYSVVHCWANIIVYCFFVVTDPYVEVFQWGADWWGQQPRRSGYLCCYTAGRWSASYRRCTAPEGREPWPTHPLTNSLQSCQSTPEPAPESHLRNNKLLYQYISRYSLIYLTGISPSLMIHHKLTLPNNASRPITVRTGFRSNCTCGGFVLLIWNRAVSVRWVNGCGW